MRWTQTPSGYCFGSSAYPAVPRPRASDRAGHLAGIRRRVLSLEVLCQRLDGVPLSNRVGGVPTPVHVDPTEVHNNLDDHFPLLVRIAAQYGAPSKPSATPCNWSCNLLEGFVCRSVSRQGVYAISPRRLRPPSRLSDHQLRRRIRHARSAQAPLSTGSASGFQKSGSADGRDLDAGDHPRVRTRDDW